MTIVLKGRTHYNVLLRLLPACDVIRDLCLSQRSQEITEVVFVTGATAALWLPAVISGRPGQWLAPRAFPRSVVAGVAERPPGLSTPGGWSGSWAPAPQLVPRAPQGSLPAAGATGPLGFLPEIQSRVFMVYVMDRSRAIIFLFLARDLSITFAKNTWD